MSRNVLGEEVVRRAPRRAWRPPYVDVDAPDGFVKHKLRRLKRRVLKLNLLRWWWLARPTQEEP